MLLHVCAVHRHLLAGMGERVSTEQRSYLLSSCLYSVTRLIDPARDYDSIRKISLPFSPPYPSPFFEKANANAIY